MTGRAKGSKPAPRKAVRIRRATMRDFPNLLALELAAFQPHRRASVASLRRSVKSRHHQSVWVIDDPGLDPPLAGLLVLWHFPRRIRVYDVATHPESRGAGHGYRLMQHAERLAKKAGLDWVSLEADPGTKGLVEWYLAQGYVITAEMPDFYAVGHGAVRMRKRM